MKGTEAAGDFEGVAMGTNYYYYKQQPCPHCGRDYTARHIGKSSAGWCFALHVYPEDGINTLDNWKDLLFVPRTIIKNEYGEIVTPHELLDIIRNRQSGNVKTPTWLALNHAVCGPNHLARCRINDGSCIGHGEGTWDYCVGEFS